MDVLTFKANLKPQMPDMELHSKKLQEIKDEIWSLKVNGRTYASPEPHLPLTPLNVIAAQYSHLEPEAFNLRHELNEELKEKLKVIKVS